MPTPNPRGQKVIRVRIVTQLPAPWVDTRARREPGAGCGRAGRSLHTLVLDEATALLDPTAACRPDETLAATVRGRTVIAVAHRLHTTRDADRIAVMEDGRITELGSHQDLVAHDTSYAALWLAWNGPTD